MLQGKPTLTYSRDGLPEFDYAVSVTRATAPDRYEIYTATIQKRLPKFKLPLAPDDRDALLDLQAAFSRAYDLGGFVTQIDYKTPPPLDVPLTDAYRGWIDDMLKQIKDALTRETSCSRKREFWARRENLRVLLKLCRFSHVQTHIFFRVRLLPERN